MEGKALVIDDITGFAAHIGHSQLPVILIKDEAFKYRLVCHYILH